MGEISSDLKNFKASVGPNIGSMNSACDSIVDKIQDLSTSTTSFKGEVSNSYDSVNKNSVLARLDKVSSIYSQITSSVGSDLKGLISDAQTVVSLVEELEKINKDIEEQQSIINSSSGDSNEAKNNASAAQSKINELNIKFNEKHEEAKTKLASLKGKDGSIQFTSDFSPSNDEVDMADLQYGTFELHEFTASNGITIKYWVYTPDYGKDVENLPLMLYMHGGSTHQKVSPERAVQYGLGNLVANKKITPSGIVVIPAVEDYTEEGVKALKELTDKAVADTHADPDRVSVSGHSYGGITSFRLINSYPGYFSCCVPISGVDNVTEAFNGVKVWSFNGDSEGGNTRTSYSSGEQAVRNINRIGGEAYMTTLQTGHSGTNKVTFEREYTSPEGEKINPIEWAFKQSRS